MRNIASLTADTSGWDIIKTSIKTAKNKITVLPVMSKTSAEQALYQTQVTTRSYMGAIIYYTGGLLIDNGWIRILGSGNTKLSRSLPAWNNGKTFKEFGERPGYLLIGDDTIGGFFAINGGALGSDAGIVYYLAPDTLKWESLGRGYTDFIDFCFNGDLGKFYFNFKWKNELAPVHGDSVYSFYPYLWSAEGKDPKAISRKIVPVQEQYVFTIDTIKQLSK